MSSDNRIAMNSNYRLLGHEYIGVEQIFKLSFCQPADKSAGSATREQTTIDEESTSKRKLILTHRPASIPLFFST